eukprot:CAMPEP_0179171946 /NCGR_PEP_ID=MMETSP0796-20121207/84780_1 /TAXON_ID=73915 /ORGANISM="Pyrodinium bahamense, Strain pbaha01" /LENGTH=34 /DNA_ID= /DNA_START= /DNA_END= /DNA_ORIENTATION=
MRFGVVLAPTAGDAAVQLWVALHVTTKEQWVVPL